MARSDDDELWQGPPPPPDPDVVLGDLSCQGILAITLREALLEVQQQNAVAERDDGEAMSTFNEPSKPSAHESDPSTTTTCEEPTAINLTDEAVNSIMESLGLAIVQSQLDQYELQHQHNESKNSANARNDASTPKQLSSSSSSDVTLAPSAILRGRLDHYNRIGSKWRFVVCNAELTTRLALDRNRRKRERPSLWSVSTAAQGHTVRSADVPIKIPRLEILAYNDVE